MVAMAMKTVRVSAGIQRLGCVMGTVIHQRYFSCRHFAAAEQTIKHGCDDEQQSKKRNEGCSYALYAQSGRNADHLRTVLRSLLQVQTRARAKTKSEFYLWLEKDADKVRSQALIMGAVWLKSANSPCLWAQVISRRWTASICPQCGSCRAQCRAR